MILDDLPQAVGLSNLWSVISLPALLVIWLTAVFGLNDVRALPLQHVLSRAGLIEFGLGCAFFAMFVGSWLMLSAIAMGANLYTWRGTILMWGIAGVFTFVGTFAPWRIWIRTLAERQVVI